MPAARLVVALAASVLSALAPAFAHATAPPEAKAQSTHRAQSLTLAALAANQRYASAAAANRTQRLNELIAAVQARREDLAALIEEDPAAALRVTLPARMRASFPVEAAPYLEQDAQEEGQLVVYHVDAFEPASSHFLYFLDTANGRLSLRFAAQPPELQTGAKLRIRGLRIDSALLVESGGAGVTVMSGGKAAALPNTLGAQRTLMIYVNFSDNTSQPFSMATAQSMFATVSNYWNEASYQQTWLTGDVAGWFTVPVSSTTCDYNSLATYAKQAAAGAGYALANYDHYVYVFPAWTACTWSGMGQIGGSPTEAWINPKNGLRASTFAHEMGHNLGIYHAHSLSCSGGVPIAASGCTKVEYGDRFDPMGATQETPHYNAFMKEMLGWLNAGISPPIVAVAAQPGSATYTIAPLEIGRDGSPRALKVPRTAACGSATDFFYVESRQAFGFDSYIASLTTVPAGSTISPATNLQTGVLIHDAIPGGASVAGSLNSSMLLDMAATTTGWAGPALVAGTSFTDPVSGLTITPVSVGSSAATVTVSYPPMSCTRAAPTVALTPTGTQYTSAGATANYTVSVTNNDSCSCAASSFSVSTAVPAGWAATDPSIGQIAPGSSAAGSLSITSAAGAAPAFYTVPTTASNSTAPSFAASADATIAVVATNAAPTVALAPSGTQSMNAGGTLAYSVTVTNNDSAAASFNVAAAVPAGWSATSAQTGSIAAGGSATVPVSVTSGASTTAGTYTVPISATNTVAPSAAASVNATVSVTVPPPPGPASLGVGVATDKSTYTRPAKGNQTVYASITTTVTTGGSPVSGAAVSVTVKNSKGSGTILSATTGGAGTAVVSYAIKSKAATGTYAVTSKATAGSATASGSTSFTVQ